MTDPNKREGGKKTLVEEGTKFKGALTSTCPIEVKGFVEGELTAPALTVSATGAVHGQVKVAEFASEGEISGEFDADIVRLSGVVKDNTVIRAKSLEVKLAPANGKMQVIFGECTLEVGEEQSKEKSVRPSSHSARPAAAQESIVEKAAYASTPPPRHEANGSNGSNGSVAPGPLEPMA